MARQFYSEAERNSILSRVTTARKQGVKWVEAHAIAKKAGFHGGLQALMFYVSKSKKKSRQARPAPATVAVEPAAGVNHELGAAIDRLVQDRVRAAVERAIDVLKSAL